MAFIISVVQRKGGCGKTTIAVNLADGLARIGHAVCLVDADPQGSARHWASPGGLPCEVEHLPLGQGDMRGWVALVRACGKGRDVLVIDAPPHIDQVVGGALAISDLALLPCGASSLDIRGLEQTLELVRTVRTAKPLDVAVVPNRADLRTLEGRQIAAQLAELGEEVAPTIRESASLRRSAACGVGVAQAAAGSAGSHDLAALTAFVRKRLLQVSVHGSPTRYDRLRLASSEGAGRAAPARDGGTGDGPSTQALGSAWARSLAPRESAARPLRLSALFR